MRLTKEHKTYLLHKYLEGLLPLYEAHKPHVGHPHVCVSELIGEFTDDRRPLPSSYVEGLGMAPGSEYRDLSLRFLLRQ